MRYGFINNFSQALAADLAAGATTMTLDGGGSLLADASSTFVYVLTLFDADGNTEIVHVTSGGTNTPTIVRGEEGTADQAWPAGTGVELRLTAAAASGFAWGLPSDAIDAASVSIQPERSSADMVASGLRSVAVGARSKASGYLSVSIGAFSAATGSTSAAYGSGSTADGEDSLALGDDAAAMAYGAVAIGSGAYAQSINSLTVGFQAYDYGGSNSGVALGELANIEGEGSISIGHSATTFAAGQLALGPNAYPNQIQSALDVTAIPVMRDSIASAQSYQHATAMRVTLPALLRTGDADLTTTGDKESLTLPANTALCVDRIESLVISSAGSGSTPTISIGTTLGGSEILASHVMAGDTVLSREQLVSTPLANAVTALYFKVDTAAAAAMTVRFVVHGYVMET